MNARTESPSLEGLRVLELTPRFSPALGGVERYVEGLARELTRAGATVEVSTSDVVRDRPFSRGEFPESQGSVPVRRHRAVLAASAPHGTGIVFPGMALDALRSRFDVMHAHSFGRFPLWAGQLARGLRGIPLIVTPHSDPGSATTLARRWSRFVARTAVRGADRTVALSRREAAWLSELGVPPERIRVIPPGIDLGEFERLPRVDRDPRGPIVLFVGRLYSEQKGLVPLVRAMARLPAETRPLLRLVGDDWGGREPALALARSLGLADRVVALGAVTREELLQEYAAADLFVLPSLFDSFPVVLLEAMAAGLPVVATCVGGVPEIVQEGRTGLLVPPGDSLALAEAMRVVLDDPGLRSRWGSEGRQRAARFAWSNVVPGYARLFAEVARRGASVEAVRRTGPFATADRTDS
ncbi:MAG: glycosyltransferase family 4 protein [Thermoplasmata archaeon]|jgi:glycosyltransferase involved in cell wall biosynthesis